MSIFDHSSTSATRWSRSCRRRPIRDDILLLSSSTQTQTRRSTSFNNNNNKTRKTSILLSCVLFSVFAMMGASLSSLSSSSSSQKQSATTMKDKDEEAATSMQYYYNNWCGGSLKYLDDKNCAKVFPTLPIDREWTCPISPSLEVPEGYARDGSLPSMHVDTALLAGLVPNDANICVILTKRVLSRDGRSSIELYNKYFCSGAYSRDDVYETWSSSKIFAMANAAVR